MNGSVWDQANSQSIDFVLVTVLNWPNRTKSLFNNAKLTENPFDARRGGGEECAYSTPLTSSGCDTEGLFAFR